MQDIDRIFPHVITNIIDEGPSRVRKIFIKYGVHKGISKKMLYKAAPTLSIKYLLTPDGKMQLLCKVLSIDIDGADGQTLSDFLVRFLSNFKNHIYFLSTLFYLSSSMRGPSCFAEVIFS
jgi:hypothetical protein